MTLTVSQALLSGLVSLSQALHTNASCDLCSAMTCHHYPSRLQISNVRLHAASPTSTYNILPWQGTVSPMQCLTARAHVWALCAPYLCSPAVGRTSAVRTLHLSLASRLRRISSNISSGMALRLKELL